MMISLPKYFWKIFFWNLKLIWIATMNIRFIYKKLFLIFMVEKCSINTWQINEDQNMNFTIYFSLQSGNWVTLDVSNHEIHVHRINKYPWRMAWQPTPVFLPGESHGQRSLVVYSSWGHRVRATTEVTYPTCTTKEIWMEFHQTCPILWVKNQSGKSFHIRWFTWVN